MADRSSYRGAERLSAHPQPAGRFVAEYPRGALDEGRRAVVVVQALIDEDGSVAEALPLAGASADFVDAALAALRRTRFTPAEADGIAVRARVYFAVRFAIE